MNILFESLDESLEESIASIPGKALPVFELCREFQRQEFGGGGKNRENITGTPYQTCHDVRGGNLI